jgi:hypothetical protein
MSIEKLVKQNIRIGRLLSGCAASLFFVNWLQTHTETSTF